MKNIYNKGKYRNGEWAKRLRPYGKRMGNKGWRRTGRNMDCIEYDQVDSVVGFSGSRSKRKSITVLFTIKSFGDYTYKSTSRYHSMCSARDVMKRNKVLTAKILT